MARTCVILQSNYIPWRGYFDLIHDADVFVFHDDLQYTHGDWRNRNRIHTRNGPQWLTIPCGRSEKRLICEVEVTDQAWKRQHRRLIEEHYRAAPVLAESSALLDVLYDNDMTNLSAYNQRAIRHIAGLLGIDVEFRDSRELDAPGRRSEKLAHIVRAVGADRYLSGPSAKAYIDPAVFADAGIELAWKHYPEYPEHRQCWAPYDGTLSIVDLLLNTGPDAARHIWPEDPVSG